MKNRSNGRCAWASSACAWYIKSVANSSPEKFAPHAVNLWLKIIQQKLSFGNNIFQPFFPKQQTQWMDYRKKHFSAIRINIQKEGELTSDKMVVLEKNRF